MMADRIRAASSAIEFAHARDLIKEYASTLDTDLCFQGFDAELANLPDVYKRPDGCVLLAWHDDKLVGCVALRKYAQGIAELKRLYVRPIARGLGIGRALTLAALAEARQAGYQRVVLDTLADMTNAQSLYLDLGFRDIDPYYDNPIPGARYLGLTL